MTEVIYPDETAAIEIIGSNHDWRTFLMRPIELEC